MKIHVPSIPEEGKHIEFHPGLVWVKNLVSGRFADLCDPEAGLAGEVLLLRTHVNVTLQGEMHFRVQPTCDRCGKKFVKDIDLPFFRHLTPYFNNPDDQREAGEEVELNEDDLNFSFYHNEEIDLAEILSEEIFLSLPMSWHCREDCKGLCPHCGVDLNETQCACGEVKEDSPFKVLKSLKLPAKAP